MLALPYCLAIPTLLSRYQCLTSVQEYRLFSSCDVNSCHCLSYSSEARILSVRIVASLQVSVTCICHTKSMVCVVYKVFRYHVNVRYLYSCDAKKKRLVGFFAKHPVGFADPLGMQLPSHCKSKLPCFHTAYGSSSSPAVIAIGLVL